MSEQQNLTKTYAKGKITMGICCILLAIILSCNENNHPQHAPSTNNDSIAKAKDPWQQMQWLIGSWHQQSKLGNYIEVWQPNGEDTIAGKAYMIKQSDTVWQELLTIKRAGKDIQYVVMIPEMKMDTPVVFTLSRYNRDSFLFVNKQRDFPNEICYTKINEDSLQALVSGREKGVDRAELFAMKRKQP